MIDTWKFSLACEQRKSGDPAPAALACLWVSSLDISKLHLNKFLFCEGLRSYFWYSWLESSASSCRVVEGPLCWNSETGLVSCAKQEDWLILPPSHDPLILPLSFTHLWCRRCLQNVWINSCPGTTWCVCDHAWPVGLCSTMEAPPTCSVSWRRKEGCWKKDGLILCYLPFISYLKEYNLLPKHWNFERGV